MGALSEELRLQVDDQDRTSKSRRLTSPTPAWSEETPSPDNDLHLFFGFEGKVPIAIDPTLQSRSTASAQGRYCAGPRRFSILVSIIMPTGS